VYSVRFENLIAAGNLAGGGGGALHASHVTLSVFDSTITGNRVGGAATGAGIGGVDAATLSLANSIVYGDDTGGGPGAEIAGFSSPTVTYTDACSSGVPFPGGGNICVDPKLVNPSGFPAPDVHETAASPTIDQGSNALVPTGLSQDFEGDARISDGNNDAVAAVDMGADERPSTPTAAIVVAFSAAATPKPGGLYVGEIPGASKRLELHVTKDGKHATAAMFCFKQRVGVMPRFPIVAGAFKAKKTLGSSVIWAISGKFVSATKARASVALKALCDGKGGVIALKLSR
jgi:hypothetical protein